MYTIYNVRYNFEVSQISYVYLYNTRYNCEISQNFYTLLQRMIIEWLKHVVYK
jgi:hypothetical protein